MAAVVQFVAGVGGFVVATLFWIPAGLLLIAGALLLAFSGRRTAPPREPGQRAGQVSDRPAIEARAVGSSVDGPGSLYRGLRPFLSCCTFSLPPSGVNHVLSRQASQLGRRRSPM